MIKAITTAHDKQHTVFCLFDTVKLPKKLNVCLPAGYDIIQFYSLHQHHRHYIHDTEYNSGLVSVGVGTPNSNILHISHYFFFLKQCTVKLFNYSPEEKKIPFTP